MFFYLLFTCIIWDVIGYAIIKKAFSKLSFIKGFIISTVVATFIRCNLNLYKYGLTSFIILVQVLIVFLVFAILLYLEEISNLHEMTLKKKFILEDDKPTKKTIRK